jgi:8-hydroxy-5-deazaflavin:NADPH oxidoreductase
MSISILGAGTVARTLATALSAKGHPILVGCRNLQSPNARALAALKNPGASLGSLQEAADSASLIILAINPWTEIERALSDLSPASLEGKTIVDLSNNIRFIDPPSLAFTDRSMGEYLQALLPKSHLVKTLNFLPAEMMVDPLTQGIDPAIMWLAGNHPEAKGRVGALLHDLGWKQIVDLGDMSQSRLQESMALIATRVVANILSTASKT